MVQWRKLFGQGKDRDDFRDEVRRRKQLVPFFPLYGLIDNTQSPSFKYQ